MKLTRIVPAHRKSATLAWLKVDFLKMSPKYREIRGKSRRPMDSCFWCHHKFEDGEMMGLAGLKGKGNKVICATCAAKAAKEPTDA